MAVAAVYLSTWCSPHDQTTSQTIGFFAWLIGHVLRAFNMRSERQPIFQIGISSIRMILIWGAAVAIFLVGISIILYAQHLMKITSLAGNGG